MNIPRFSGLTAEEVRNILSQYKLPDDAAYSLQNDIDTLGFLDTLTAKLEWHVLKNARGHDNYSLAILRSMKGLGKILSLTVNTFVGKYPEMAAIDFIKVKFITQNCIKFFISVYKINIFRTNPNASCLFT